MFKSLLGHPKQEKSGLESKKKTQTISPPLNRGYTWHFANSDHKKLSFQSGMDSSYSRYLCTRL